MSLAALQKEYLLRKHGRTSAKTHYSFLLKQMCKCACLNSEKYPSGLNTLRFWGLRAILTVVSWYGLGLTCVCQIDAMGMPLSFSLHPVMHVISNSKREKCVPALKNGHKINIVAGCGSQTKPEFFRNLMALIKLSVHDLNMRHFEDQLGHSTLE